MLAIPWSHVAQRVKQPPSTQKREIQLSLSPIQSPEPQYRLCHKSLESDRTAPFCNGREYLEGYFKMDLCWEYERGMLGGLQLPQASSSRCHHTWNAGPLGTSRSLSYCPGVELFLGMAYKT